MNVQQFYLLKIKASSLKVMIPCHNVGNVGLRKVVRNVEVKEILDYLMAGAVAASTDWKDRFKENSERMRTGSLLDVAAVLKGVWVLARTKSSPFAERNSLDL